MGSAPRTPGLIRPWQRGLAVLVDLAFIASTLLALDVIATGGGIYYLAGIRVSSMSARNPLAVAFILLALRLTVLASAPLIWVSSWCPEAMAPLAARCSGALRHWLAALDAKRVRWVLLGMLGVSGAVKAVNILHHYGFYYGDDVEIHTMTFSVLEHRDLGVWNLRSPFYPLLFIYPLQKVLRDWGFVDPFVLIGGGRLVVACFSLVNLWLVFRIGSRLFRSVPVAMMATYFLWVAHLQVRLGSSEEPRTVSTTFLLASFWLLIAVQGSLGAALAGLALGVAASIRFSEAIFIAPLSLTLVLEKRFRSLAIAVVFAALTSLLILGPGDRLYWPSMFFSLRNIVDFTLIRGLSSRGYEPIWQYMRIAPEVTDLFLVALFLYSLRLVRRTLITWSLLPLILLSLFPHKDERYLLPLLPFWALCAAAGFWQVLSYSAEQARGFRCYLALYLVIGVTLFEVAGWRFRRSEDAVDVARTLSHATGVRDVAMEEAATVTGASLYLAAKANVATIDARRLGEAGYLQSFLARPEAQYVVLSDRGLSLDGCQKALRTEGYVEVLTSGRYRVFLSDRSEPTPSLPSAVD